MKIFIVIGVTMLISCSQSSKAGKSEISSDVTTIALKPDTAKVILFSDIVSKIQVKILETSKESLVSDILKMDIDGDYFILNSHNKQVMVYDSLGNYKYSVGKKGRGHGELSFPSGFSLDKSKKEVWVNNNSRFMHKYDYNGTLLEIKPVEILFKDFQIGENGFVYFHTGKNYNFDKDGKEICSNLWIRNAQENITRLFPYDSEVYPNGGLSFDTKIPFCKRTNNIIYSYVFCDTIYSISNERISPLYIVNFGDKALKIDISKKRGEEILDYIRNNKNEAFYVQNVLENDSFLKFNYVMGTSLYDVFYNKKNKNIIEGRLVDDLFGATLYSVSQKGNTFICYIQAAELKLDTKLRKYIDAETYDKLQTLSESSNPILIEFEMKE